MGCQNDSNFICCSGDLEKHKKIFLFRLLILQDSSGNDIQHIQEMMDILDNKLGYANIILLVLEGSTPRFSSGLEDMLKQMS